MSAAGILVVHRERRTQRALQRILGASRLDVEVCDSLVAARARVERGPPRLAVVDHRLLVPGEGEGDGAALAGPELACLVLLEDARSGDLPRLFASASLTNLLVNPMPLLAEELPVTVLKLLRRDLFGVEKYLSWGAPAVEVELTDAAERSLVVEALGAEVRRRLGAHVATLARLVADELLSNALYKAPVDEGGARYRLAELRHSPRQLVGRERVRLRHACDGRYLAIEVTDHFGTLDRHTILANLARAVRRGAPGQVSSAASGAGLGLALVHGACTHLVFNLAAGRRTEVIALIDVRFQPRRAEAISSFNVFVEEGSRP